MHSFEWCDTKRFAHRRHDEHVAVFIHLIHLFAAKESDEVETVGYAAAGCQTNHLFHHVATASHHKSHVVNFFEHHCGSFNKVFRTFLHGDAAQECYDFFFARSFFDFQVVVGQRFNSVVHCGHLVGRDAVFFDNCSAREVAHGDDVVGLIHAVFLDSEHNGVHVAAATVVVGGMHVNHQRLAANLLGVDAGRIGEPVVRVDYVELGSASNNAGNNRIVVDFLHEVLRILS